MSKQTAQRRIRLHSVPQRKSVKALACAWCHARPRRKHTFHCSDTCRFWSKVERGPSCWRWVASRNYRNRHNGRNGFWYGQFTLDLDGRRVCVSAHRFAYQLTHGPIPRGKFVLHACDEPACVRPDHLWLGTQKDNMADAATKGRTHVSRPRGQRVSRAVIAAIRRRIASGEQRSRVAASVGVSNAFVTLLMNGQRRTLDKPEVCA